ncbi:multiple cyclophane-containing RiPP AmcA [Hamadaea sp. NPDC051192]|uniref:multiple cyclophane-containing RiPP AmcA n=1 Tax=Hamadaea sp. NPDC051192 TaxID=3154940 RepID=UPI00342C5BE0
MTILQLLARADADALASLGVTEAAATVALPQGAKFDNRPTWDNVGPKFDNRPSWDNWNKK